MWNIDHKQMISMTTLLKNTRSFHHVVRKLSLQPIQVKQPRSFWTSITSSPPSSEEVTNSSAIPPESYTFQSIAQEVADEHDLSLAKSKRILNTVFDTIAEVRESSHFVCYVSGVDFLLVSRFDSCRFCQEQKRTGQAEKESRDVVTFQPSDNVTNYICYSCLSNYFSISPHLFIYGQNLAQNKVVKIKDFGKFSNEHSRERKGYNFSTGEAVDIPAGRRVKYTAYTAIKDTINK